MEPSFILLCCPGSQVGVVIAAMVSVIPGLHIYNVIAFTMLFAFAAMYTFKSIDHMLLTCFIIC